LSSSGGVEPEVFWAAKWVLVTFPDDPYTLSTVYAKILCKGDSKRNMQDEPEKKLDRGRLAATKWLPMSAIGAAIPFVIGVIMQLPVEQVLVAAGLTSTLVFSGLWMQSYGRERQYRSAA
jgi:hypothetical protein